MALALVGLACFVCLELLRGTYSHSSLPRAELAAFYTVKTRDMARATFGVDYCLCSDHVRQLEFLFK